jgi:MFS family permease
MIPAAADPCQVTGERGAGRSVGAGDSVPPDATDAHGATRSLGGRLARMSARPGTERHGPQDGLWSRRHRTLTVGLVLTITLVAFEALAVSTVMPIVADDLGDLELYGWVFTAFMLGSLIGIVVSGGVIDRRGLGVPFAVGIGLFSIGLLVGGLAPTMAILVGARFVQGLGAGAVPPIAYVAIGRSLPESLRPRMFAVLSTAWVLPGVIGPAIAGLIGETVGWRFVFLGLLPIVVLAAAISYPALRRIGPADAEAAAGEARAAGSLRHRLPLALLVAGGSGLFLAGLTSGEPIALVALVAAGLALAIPALRGLTPAGTLRAARGMPTAVLLRGVLTFAFFGVDAYVALTLVDWRGQSAAQAGLSLTAATLTWTAGAWIQAHAANRWRPERFVQAGYLVVVSGLLAFGIVLIPELSPWLAIPTFGLAGLGMGLAYAPLTLIVLRDAPVGEQGSASSALSLTDSLGTALGTGVVGAFVAASVRSTGEPLGGLVTGFAVAIGVGVLGLALSSRLSPAEPRRGSVGAAVVEGS